MLELTDGQRAFVRTHIASGVHKYSPMRALCLAHDPPFDISYPQFKRIRFAAGVKIAKLREEGAETALKKGLALKAARVAKLKALVTRHLNLMEDRAEEMEEEVAGGDTGLMTRDYKDGLPVYKYDAAFIRELRGLFDDIAKEVGDRQQKMDVTSNGKSLTFAALVQSATDEPSPGQNDLTTEPV